ncbi:MAG: DEAD/DEAH box helicase, partial [Dehalococcoidia bacterium]|nr:DEAD/DEAH box helicase [Dehalococcoidia bacterium]
NEAARFLLLFPTKALAQDQLRSLKQYALELAVATFDGDTPQSDRRDIRRSTQVVLTNPDMLHVGILPHHRHWATFLANLRYVVIDEAHAYRGVFGSHVANILRRLRRACALYGNQPSFIASSATIANPGEHVRALTGEPATVVDHDGSPHGSRTFVLWNPPVVEPRTMTRRNAGNEAADLIAMLVRAGIRAIAFAKSRKVAELLSIYAKRVLQRDARSWARGHDSADDLAGRVAAYRAGYSHEVRRELERQLAEGQLLAVTSTNALELGIDIGDLSATILTGYPGSVASVWQQVGRSGRATEESLAILVAQDDPLDQHLMRRPSTLFSASSEEVRINPTNPQIVRQHVLCASYEAPITAEDTAFFGDTLFDAIKQLLFDGAMVRREDRWLPSSDQGYPASAVNIRSTSSEAYQLLLDDRVVEVVEASMAFSQLHPGAIYLHQGESLLIVSMDHNARHARARRFEEPLFSQAEEQTTIRVL